MGYCGSSISIHGIGSRRRKSEVRTSVVEVMNFDRPDYLAGKEITHERMEELGPVILMDGKRFETGLTSEGRKVTERIRADMDREWPWRRQ